MKPTDIGKVLQRDLIGQRRRPHVPVAIFKHRQGEKFGNLLLIGNSGAGKTTIMRAVERLYEENETFREYRRADRDERSHAGDREGVVDTHRLFRAARESGRSSGPDATAEPDRRLMERATVCFDEIDKISAVVAQALRDRHLDPADAVDADRGREVLYPVTVMKGKRPEKSAIEVSTGKMLFLCAGAFEAALRPGVQAGDRRRRRG